MPQYPVAPEPNRADDISNSSSMFGRCGDESWTCQKCLQQFSQSTTGCPLPDVPDRLVCGSCDNAGCVEPSSLKDNSLEGNPRRRSMVRSRASIDLHKRSSLVAGLRGQSNASFEELMSKIKLNDTSKSTKGDIQKRQEILLSRSASTSPSQSNSSSTRSAGLHGVSHNADSLPSATRHGSKKSISYRNDLLSTDDGAQQSSVLQGRPRLLPISPRGLGLSRRRSTPQTWRVPSTKYEADEADSIEDDELSHTTEVKSSINDTAVTLEKKNKETLTALKLPKSSSSGHLPGMFAKRGGRALGLHLGGSNKCAGCLQSVFPFEQTAGPHGSWFHKTCLRCTQCKKKMDSSSKFVQDDADGRMNVYCRTCWDNRK